MRALITAILLWASTSIAHDSHFTDIYLRGDKIVAAVVFSDTEGTDYTVQYTVNWETWLPVQPISFETPDGVTFLAIFSPGEAWAGIRVFEEEKPQGFSASFTFIEDWEPVEIKRVTTQWLPMDKDWAVDADATIQRLTEGLLR